MPPQVRAKGKPKATAQIAFDVGEKQIDNFAVSAFRYNSARNARGSRVGFDLRRRHFPTHKKDILNAVFKSRHKKYVARKLSTSHKRIKKIFF